MFYTLPNFVECRIVESVSCRRSHKKPNRKQNNGSRMSTLYSLYGENLTVTKIVTSVIVSYFVYWIIWFVLYIRRINKTFGDAPSPEKHWLYGNMHLVRIATHVAFLWFQLSSSARPNNQTRLMFHFFADMARSRNNVKACYRTRFQPPPYFQKFCARNVVSSLYKTWHL